MNDPVKTMKAAAFSAFGPPDVLRAIELEAPVPPACSPPTSPSAMGGRLPVRR